MHVCVYLCVCVCVCVRAIIDNSISRVSAIKCVRIVKKCVR